MDLAELAGLCEEVTWLPGRRQFMFRCPSHDKACASAQMEDGHAAVSCDEGCSQTMLLGGLGLTAAELVNGGPPPKRAKWEVHAERRAGIDEWELQLIGVAHRMWFDDRSMPLEELIGKLTACVADSGEHGCPPPPWLEMGPHEIEGSIAFVVGQVFEGKQLPAVNGNGAVQAPEVEPPLRALSLTQLYQSYDMWAAKSWVWQGVLPHDSLSLLIGKSESGKSTFIYALIHAIVKGLAFLGRDTERGKVVYIAGDPTSEYVAAHVFRELGLQDGVLTIAGALVMRHDPMPELRRIIADYKPNLVVCDTLAATVDLDTDSYGGSYRAQMPLVAIARDLSPNVLVAHHSQKSAIDTYNVVDAALGSVGVAAVASTRMVTRSYRRKGETFHTFEMSNLRIGEPIKGEWLVVKEPSGEINLGRLWADKQGEMAEEAVLTVMSSTREECLTITGVRDLLTTKLSRGQIYQALSALIQQQQVEIWPDKKHYRLARRGEQHTPKVDDVFGLK